jgi:predicted oxidoreductase
MPLATLKTLYYLTAMSYIPISQETRQLVKSDLVVSPISWGMWRFTDTDVKGAQARVEAALSANVTLFDTADCYGAWEPIGFGGAESLLGDVFHVAPHLRAKMVLATKSGVVRDQPYDSSAGYISAAIDASLKRLKTEQIDLWQIHRPDILTHPAEIAPVLEAAHAAGKIRALGVSNYAPAQIAALQAHLALPIISNQVEFSPLETAPLWKGVMDQANQNSMAVMAWSPLAGGRLVIPDDANSKAAFAALQAHADAYDVSVASATYSWIMAHPARPIPIVGTQNLARIAEIPDAFKPRWTRKQWYAVLQAAMGETLP